MHIALVPLSQLIHSRFDPLFHENHFSFEPSAFPLVPLAKIADINPAESFRALAQNDPISFIPMASIDARKGVITTPLSTQVSMAKGFTKFREGDLLWAKITPCMQNGKSAIARGLFNGVGCGSTEFHVIRPKGDNVLVEYLYYLLRDPRLLQTAIRFFAGSAGQQRVPKEFLSNLKIPVPDLATQQKIVRIYEEARTQSEQLEQEILEYERLIEQEIYNTLGLSFPQQSCTTLSYFVSLADVLGERLDCAYYASIYYKAIAILANGTYSTNKLGEMLVNIKSGATPRTDDPSLYANSGIKMYRILNIKPSAIDDEEVKYISDSVHNGLLGRSQLEVDDILMTITGRVGTAAIVTDRNLPGNINQHIARMRIDASVCSPLYLVAFLNTRLGLLLSNRSVSGGTRGALDYTAIRNLRIPVPPLDEQNALVHKISILQKGSHCKSLERIILRETANEKITNILLSGQ